MDQSTWTTLINGLTSLALTLLAPLLMVGINALLKKAALDQNAAVQAAARTAIGYAEETAAAWLRQQGTKLDPSKKLEMAIEQLLVKVPGVTPEEARVIITSQLPQVGLGAAGFVQAVATAARQ